MIGIEWGKFVSSLKNNDESFEELELLVQTWAHDRGIFESSNPKSQLLKTVSEVGELADAVNKNDMSGIVDGIGDIVVTLILLAKMYEVTVPQCTQSAYDEIYSRNGAMVNGVFVKEEK